MPETAAVSPYDRVMRPLRFAAILAISAVLGLTACSSSSHKGTPASSTTTATSAPTTTSASASSTSTSSAPTSAPTTTTAVTTPNGPRFASLSGPPQPVNCYAPTSVQVRWNTRNTAQVTLSIDGGPLFATYPGGVQNQMLPLACDGSTQRYTFTAHATDGRTATKTLTLTERQTQ